MFNGIVRFLSDNERLQILNETLTIICYPAVLLIILFIFRDGIRGIIESLRILSTEFVSRVASIKVFDIEFKRVDVEQALVDLEKLRVGLFIARSDHEAHPAELRTLLKTFDNEPDERRLRSLPLEKKMELLSFAIEMADADHDFDDIEYREIRGLVNILGLEVNDKIHNTIYHRVRDRVHDENPDASHTDVLKALPQSLRELFQKNGD